MSEINEIFLWELKGIRTELIPIDQEGHDALVSSCKGDIKEWHPAKYDRKKRYIGRFIKDE